MSNKIKVNYGLDVSVEILRDTITDNAKVKVHAPIYMNKEWIMNHSYKASQFSDYDIIHDRDFITVMCKAYPLERN